MISLLVISEILILCSINILKNYNLVMYHGKIWDIYSDKFSMVDILSMIGTEDFVMLINYNSWKMLWSKMSSISSHSLMVKNTVSKSQPQPHGINILNILRKDLKKKLLSLTDFIQMLKSISELSNVNKSSKLWPILFQKMPNL